MVLLNYPRGDTMKTEAHSPLKFELFKQLQKRIPFSRTTLDRLIHEGDFPRPYKLSKASKAWLSSEVDAWIEERVKKGGESHD